MLDFVINVFKYLFVEINWECKENRVFCYVIIVNIDWLRLVCVLLEEVCESFYGIKIIFCVEKFM